MEFKSTRYKLFFSSSVTVVMIIILISVNHLLGSLNQLPEGIIFEPYTSAHYSTVEFDFYADISSIGLRNKEVSTIKHDSTFRILCFGDSWTYGWGVDVENSWPMILEDWLKQNGYSNVEVINCAQPGGNTQNYKRHAAIAIPLLKPDLVLLGVLQLNDLSQLSDRSTKDAMSNASNRTSVKHMTKSFFISSTENYVKLFYGNNPIEINPVWKASSIKLINSFNEDHLAKFESYSDTVKTLFKTGNLNPSLLNHYIKYPNQNLIYNDPNEVKTKESLLVMHADVAKIKQVCDENKSKVVFINLPSSAFTGHKIDSSFSSSIAKNQIDSMYKSVATSNNIDYIELTDYFKSMEDKRRYFYRFDGHPNRQGYRKMGAFIANSIQVYLN
ncbi:MAG: SGNH/GDSL hydrolase family protein [Flavobacteriales bacterium]|nr:SGNH/GDSL hydrolase family protein [Flavobacteriales bacterium]